MKTRVRPEPRHRGQSLPPILGSPGSYVTSPRTGGRPPPLIDPGGLMPKFDGGDLTPIGGLVSPRGVPIGPELRTDRDTTSGSEMGRWKLVSTACFHSNWASAEVYGRAWCRQHRLHGCEGSPGANARGVASNVEAWTGRKPLLKPVRGVLDCI